MPPSAIPPRALPLLAAALAQGASYGQIGHPLAVTRERIHAIAKAAGLASAHTGGRPALSPAAEAAIAALVAECRRPTTCCPACHGSGLIPTL